MPYIGNNQNISCIPAGSYEVVPRQSKHYGRHFLVEDVPGRDNILIHVIKRPRMAFVFNKSSIKRLKLSIIQPGKVVGEERWRRKDHSSKHFLF